MLERYRAWKAARVRGIWISRVTYVRISPFFGFQIVIGRFAFHYCSNSDCGELWFRRLRA